MEWIPEKAQLIKLEPLKKILINWSVAKVNTCTTMYFHSLISVAQVNIPIPLLLYSMLAYWICFMKNIEVTACLLGD